MPAKKSSTASVFTARQIKEMQFDVLPLAGMWKVMFGNPDRNFSLMVYAMPKEGKSTIMLDFANYLASNFGKALYCAVEESIKKTLRDKIIRLGADSPNLHFMGTLPAVIPAQYDFVFIDSANAAKLNYDKVVALIHKYPGKAFIFIFQSTKAGQFRGTQDLEHEVGIVMKIEQGIARIKGRYQQGTTFDVAKAYNLRR